MIDSFHERLVMGTATYALEFLEAAPQLDVLLAPVAWLVDMRRGIGTQALGLKTEIMGVVARPFLCAQFHAAPSC